MTWDVGALWPRLGNCDLWERGSTSCSDPMVEISMRLTRAWDGARLCPAGRATVASPACPHRFVAAAAASVSLCRMALLLEEEIWRNLQERRSCDIDAGWHESPPDAASPTSTAGRGNARTCFAR